MKDKYPKVSVVLLNYNGLKYLKRTLPEIFNLDYPNFEVIIVDNNSEDGSKEFIKKFKNVKLISNYQNFGYSKGKNMGVSAAKGKFVFLLDNDILIKNKKVLKNLVEFYITVENPGFISIPLFDENNQLTIRYGCFYSVYGQSNNTPIDLKKLKALPSSYESPAPIGGNMFFSKSLWSSLGGYDEKFKFHLDDYDIGARSVNLGYHNFILNLSPLLHIGNETRLDTKSWCWKYRFQLCSFSTIIIKNYNTLDMLIILPIFHLFISLKTLKNIFSRTSLRPLYSWLYSYYLFFTNLPYMIKERMIIQSRRTIRKDIFLKIKPPRLK